MDVCEPTCNEHLIYNNIIGYGRRAAAHWYNECDLIGMVSAFVAHETYIKMTQAFAILQLVTFVLFTYSAQYIKMPYNML